MGEDGIIEIRNLQASIQGEEVLKGINLTLKKGEVHALMGRNGSGKSTLAKVLMGHSDYEVTEGEVIFDGNNLLEMEPWNRARLGVFMSFQYPQAIPGLQVGNFLRKSVVAIRGENAPSAREFRAELNEAMEKLGIEKKFLSRYVNDGFSGGESKRLEILQLMLMQPRLAILDETDSGLDIDALKTVSAGINASLDNAACLIITHYQRILNHVNPNHVHVLIDGKIVASGGPELAAQLEERGYDWLEAEGTS
ncbi:MAG: Fe-S cluster assembly ATPase SufC [Candidatus Thalassarchaeaceae archaeon]|jgi:Fe-S cluster assembly ATP-binding protein|nr:Fe-S cluster assembly ATPase SufC [Candidatus Thalassarchaeaceae archaeon]MDP7042760.1 Fe-S cluster assembly ATPase SufC [Candidatus Thalassarchaeaceae archaeon]